MNYWFISDTHFNHEAILSFKENGHNLLRSFLSVEEMNETIIENWNKLIKPQDKVYHLGDVIFGNRKNFDSILSRLNGKKRLILGNHDADKEKYLAPYFQKINGARHINIKGFQAILSHIPIHEYSLSRFGINIHGHLHSSIVWDLYPEGSCAMKPNKKYINVCVENTNYKPINLDEINQLTNNRQGYGIV